jgi:hypothetical protein
MSLRAQTWIRWRYWLRVLALVAVALAGAALPPGAGSADAATRSQYLREMERRLARWTEPTVNAVSFFETSRFASYDKVSTDFDCEGLSLGVLQWAVGQGSVHDLFAKVDRRFLAREMGPNWSDLEALLKTLAEERALIEEGKGAGYARSLALTRAWQSPDYDPGKQECTRAKARGPVAFKPEKEALRGALERLLGLPEMRKAQLEAAREKGRCAYHLASLWTWKRMAPASGDLRLYLRSCEEIDPADFPWRLPALAPDYQDFLYFYDLVTQLGLGAQSGLQDLALDMPLARASTEPGGRHLAGRLHNTMRNALGWLAHCWDWQETGVCRVLATAPVEEKRRRYASLKGASGAAERRQRAVLGHHLQALHNADAWGRELDDWVKAADGSPPVEAAALATAENRLRLAVHAFLGANLAYRDYAVNVMNRKATFAFGHGCVTGTSFDFRPFLAAVAARQADWAEVLKASARGSCLP